MKQLSVELADRVLRFDGVSVIHPDRLVDALLRGVQPSNLRLTQHTPDTLTFNDNAAEQLSLDVQEPVRLNFRWLLPDSYLQLDLHEAIAQAYETKLPELSHYTPKQHDLALDRVAAELIEIERRGMVEFVKTIIYVLDVFRQNNVVWGVGRGSSCASYVLFLLGLHSVDPVWYNVPMEEFFHE